MYLHNWLRRSPDVRLDWVVVDPSSLAEEEALRDACRLVGAELVIEEVRAMEGGRPTAVHDTLLLASVFQRLLDQGGAAFAGAGAPRRRAWAGLCNVGSPDVRSYFSRVSEIPGGMLRQKPGVAGYSAAKCRPPTLPPSGEAGPADADSRRPPAVGKPATGFPSRRTSGRAWSSEKRPRHGRSPSAIHPVWLCVYLPVRPIRPCHACENRRMAMTAAVKDELNQLEITRPCCRKAETSAMLRFGEPCTS